MNTDKQPGHRSQEPEQEMAEKTLGLHPPMILHAMPPSVSDTCGPAPRPDADLEGFGQPSSEADATSDRANLIPDRSKFRRLNETAEVIKPDASTGGLVAFASDRANGAEIAAHHLQPELGACASVPISPDARARATIQRLPPVRI